jgi:peptidoglycan/LPS O-acetylase OafA/YrhL
MRKVARRSPELDGIRALAVLAVMAGHAGIPHFIGGGLGVDMFFTLSGYLITHLLLREFDRIRSISRVSFYRRRVRRLLPVLYALLGATAVYSAIA